MDNYSLQTVIENETPIITMVQDVPQLQTVVQDGMSPITTMVNAPFIEVTSVNGMTGDVVVEIVLDTFEPSHFYRANTAIIYQERLYYAKSDFTSTSTFNPSDWNTPDFSQVQADWTENDTSSNAYIQHKPNLATVATTGQYSDLNGKPNLATVATSGDFDDLINKPTIDSTLSTSSTNAVENQAITNELDRASFIGSVVSTPSDLAYVGSSNIVDGAVIASKIGNQAVTTAKVNDGAITNNKLADGTITGSKIASNTITNGNIANATIERNKLANPVCYVGSLKVEGESITINNQWRNVAFHSSNIYENSYLAYDTTTGEGVFQPGLYQVTFYGRIGDMGNLTVNYYAGLAINGDSSHGEANTIGMWAGNVNRQGVCFTRIFNFTEETTLKPKFYFDNFSDTLGVWTMDVIRLGETKE